jgi:hypothetical protein
MDRRWERNILGPEWVEFTDDNVLGVNSVFKMRDSANPDWKTTIEPSWSQIEADMAILNFSEVHEIVLPDGFLVDLDSFGKTNTTKGKCRCDMTTLMRSGCECGGV